jgi:hypothetical protein
MADRSSSVHPGTNGFARDTDRGQAAFTRTGLALYDLLVPPRCVSLGLALPERAYPRCVSPTLEQQSSRGGGGDRLFFGPRPIFACSAPRRAARPEHQLSRARRTARYHPEVYRADVLQCSRTFDP